MHSLFIFTIDSDSDFLALNIIYLTVIFCGIFTIMSKNPIITVLYLMSLFLSMSAYLMMLGLSFLSLSYLPIFVAVLSILFLFILTLINVKISEFVSETSNSLPLARIKGIFFYMTLYEILHLNRTVYSNYINVILIYIKNIHSEAMTRVFCLFWYRIFSIILYLWRLYYNIVFLQWAGIYIAFIYLLPIIIINMYSKIISVHKGNKWLHIWGIILGFFYIRILYCIVLFLFWIVLCICGIEVELPCIAYFLGWQMSMDLIKDGNLIPVKHCSILPEDSSNPASASKSAILSHSELKAILKNIYEENQVTNIHFYESITDYTRLSDKYFAECNNYKEEIKANGGIEPVNSDVRDSLNYYKGLSDESLRLVKLFIKTAEHRGELIKHTTERIREYEIKDYVYSSK